MKIDERDITRLLNGAGGEEGGLDALMPLVHERIKMLAHSQLRQQAPQPTLSATMLVNEAYMRIAQSEQDQWRDRQHFFAVATTVIRRIIIDYARRSHADKRGGDQRPLSIDLVGELPAVEMLQDKSEQLIEMDEALTRLADVDQRASRVVEYHVFGGYTFDETAEMLCISAMTAKRDWRFARAWLKREMSRGNAP